MATGLGVDIHPVYQAGTNALPGVEYGWIKMVDGGVKYVKTQNGVTYTADAHAALFRRLGVPFGGYEFAQPGTDGGKAFDVLWAECLRLGATGVTPGVDIEGAGWNATNAAARGKAFCDRARARGVRPAVYMDLSLLQATRPDLWSSNPVIWAPRYGAKPEAGGRYTGRYDVHQYSSSGTLPGSAGAVDWNQSYNNSHLMQGDDMPITDDDAKKIAGHVWYDWVWSQNNGATGQNPSQILSMLNGQLGGLTTALTAQTKLIVDNEANDVTAESLAAALAPALLPQLEQGLRDAVSNLPDVNLTTDQITAIANAAADSIGVRIVNG